MRLYRFQSALPRRERRCKRGQSRYESEFQSALPRRERPADATAVSWNPRFQSALPRRERPKFVFIASSCATFQSALPRRERLKLFHLCVLIFRYFNPRSREGSDATFSSRPSFIKISIRAPAKGATFSCRVLVSRSPYFNPRSREGSDLKIP